MDSANVIGQGSYGCIHKPSLQCTRKQNYENKVSKILKTVDANKEMKEYKLIGSIDKNVDYHLGVPYKCSIKKSEFNEKSIRKCKNSEDFFKEIDKLSLLVMNDGGYHLEDFAKEISGWKNTTENIEKMELFWLECHRILYGLKILLDNNLVHHDLKPQNIVYNIKTNRLNFIDFGFMTTTKSIKDKSKKSTNNLATFHWSFPYELAFLNKKTFINFCEKTPKERDQFYKNIINALASKDPTTISRALKTFFSFIVKPGLTGAEHKSFVMVFLQDYYTMLKNDFKDESQYDAFLNKSVETIDIFGVGIAFFHILSNSIHLINNYLIDELTDLFYYMTHFNVFRRYDIDVIISKYEVIMENSGILKKYNKHFENHMLKDGPVIQKNIETEIKKLTKENVSISEEEKQLVVTTNIIECSPGKEYNPLTKRCVKKCRPDQYRNITGRCKKKPEEKKTRKVNK